MAATNATIPCLNGAGEIPAYRAARRRFAARDHRSGNSASIIDIRENATTGRRRVIAIALICSGALPWGELDPMSRPAGSEPSAGQYDADDGSGHQAAIRWLHGQGATRSAASALPRRAAGLYGGGAPT